MHSLLSKIKRGLGVVGSKEDETLLELVEQAQDDLLVQGIIPQAINTSLGAHTITIFVNDNWNVGGERIFSQMYATQVFKLFGRSLEIKNNSGSGATC